MPSRPHRQREDSNTPHYQPLPSNMKPPTSKGVPPPRDAMRGTSSGQSSPNSPTSQSSQHEEPSPLPKKQLIVLAIIALAEQTAFNSISPYLPDMASQFPDIKSSEVGMYVGLIASAFALAQFLTNFFWGWLSDHIGRKPVILIGTILTAACFVAFGFCRTLWQAILVQIFMGLVNGNQGVVSTCLGEITDRSNQSTAFTYLPVVYGIGAVTGPLVGGFLVRKTSSTSLTMNEEQQGYPYLGPNLFSAAVLVVDLVITMIFLDESLEEAQNEPPLGTRVHNLFARMWQFTHSTRPSYVRRKSRPVSYTSRSSASNVQTTQVDNTEGDATRRRPTSKLRSILPHFDSSEIKAKDVFHRDTILLFVTYFIFQLSNIAYNSLYPIFAQASPPTGRELSPKEIGVSLGFAGIVTIIFQVGLFGRMRNKIGNKTTYRLSQGLFVVAFLLMPWVGYKNADHKGIGNGKGWLYTELGVVLIIKTIATVGGLTSALLLITNSAPDHSVLGALNGLAQTLSAAGRAVGPFISGTLFTAATRIRPKGEAMAFGIFGGIAFVGFIVSFGIKGSSLECADWSEDDHANDDDENDVEAEDVYVHDNSERQPLLNGNK